MYLIGAWVRIYVGATAVKLDGDGVLGIYSVKKQLIFQRRGVSFTGFRLVIVAQLVRAPGCGPGGRGFKSRLSPHFYSQKASSQIQTSLLNAHEVRPAVQIQCRLWKYPLLTPRSVYAKRIQQKCMP